jgi:hypothetical protein
MAAWTQHPAQGQKKQRSAREQNENTQKIHQTVAFRKVLARPSDGNQDASYRVVGSHRPPLSRIVIAHSSDGFSIRSSRLTPQKGKHSHCRRQRNSLAESGTTLGAADEQERDDGTPRVEFSPACPP